MGTKALLKVSAWLGAAVVLALMGVQGTLALWSSSVTVTPGTLTAADFTVTLTNSAGISVELPATLPLTPAVATPMLPGESRYEAVTITNGTDAGGTFSVLATMAGAASFTYPDTAPNRALAENLAISVNTGGFSPTAGCPTAGYEPVASAAATIPKGTAATWCFRILLEADAPAAAQNGAVSILAPIRVDQVAG